jgi:uroporphyrinogen decarboxylase
VGNAEQLANYRMWNYFPQSIDRRNPLVHAGSVADIAAHRFPSIDAPGESERLRRAVADHHAAGMAVAGQIPYLGGVIFETAYRLRGLDNLLEDLASRPDFAEALLDRITDNAARNVAALASAGADILFLGDDIGMPTSMLISPALWRRWFRPRLARVIQAGRAVAPGIPIAYHTDGWCLPVIGDLLDIGVGILNPVQPDCMNPNDLRERFGRRLTLWGTVGSAALMAYGRPQTVYEEVRRRVVELGPGGGLILAPAYDLEDNVPLANVEAFFAGCGD